MTMNKSAQLSSMTTGQSKAMVSSGGNTSGKTIDKYLYYDTVLDTAGEWTALNNTRVQRFFAGDISSKGKELTNWNEGGRVSNNLKVNVMAMGFEITHNEAYTQAEYLLFQKFLSTSIVKFQVFNTYPVLEMPLSAFFNMHNNPIVNGAAGDGTLNLNDSKSNGYFSIATKVADAIELPENTTFVYELTVLPIDADLLNKFNLRALMKTIRITA
ncbi:MAG: hypothetical protein GY793_10305 [Proteobacteria bacterium]|nr:hypothetical protein [Pseudomonadota bacterium]